MTRPPGGCTTPVQASAYAHVSCWRSASGLHRAQRCAQRFLLLLASVGALLVLLPGEELLRWSIVSTPQCVALRAWHPQARASSLTGNERACDGCREANCVTPETWARAPRPELSREQAVSGVFSDSGERTLSCQPPGGMVTPGRVQHTAHSLLCNQVLTVMALS